MDDGIGQMIADGIHPPKKVVETEGNPAERLIMTLVKSGKHPAKLLPAKSAVMRIFHQKLIVVPPDKFVAQRRQKNDESQQRSQES